MKACQFLRGSFLACSLFLLRLPEPATAATFDWPRWRGPDLNGISKETGWSTAWPSGGPRQIWKTSVGIGFSSLSVANGRAYTMGNTAGKEIVFCFDAATGVVVWKHTYDCELDPRFYEGGPSATPTVDRDRVFTLSRKGDLFCLEAASGKVVWQKKLNSELELKVFKENTPEWGYASSPLVQGDRLIVNVGTAGAAFDKGTGASIWTTGQRPSGYSTHVPFQIGSETCLAVAGGKKIFAIALKDGRTLWEYPWETSYDINAADPVISGNRIFISSGYDHGSALLEFNEREVKKLWEGKTLHCHLNAPVLLGGYLYGMDGNHGRKGASLHCLELETGKLQWAEPSIRPGALMVADGKLILLTEPGELVIAEASSQAFKPIARAQVLGGKCWTVPVLSNGRLYCRNSRGDLVCLDLSGKPSRAGQE